MKGPYPGWDKDLHFVRSDDLWDSQHTKLVACANQFEVVGQRVSHHVIPVTAPLRAHSGCTMFSTCEPRIADASSNGAVVAREEAAVRSWGVPLLPCRRIHASRQPQYR